MSSSIFCKKFLQCGNKASSHLCQRRHYSKLSVREKKLLQLQMEQQEKKQVVGTYLRKYFNTSTYSAVPQEAAAEAQQHIFSASQQHSTQPFHTRLSVQKYKHQSQIEKILQLELTRKRNTANPKAKSSPGRVNVQLLQKDIDEALYHSYSRKYFQHGFDVFIAKLRKECQANHRTKRVFCMENRNIANELEERLSMLVAEKQFEKRGKEHSSLDDADADSLVASIAQYHKRDFDAASAETGTAEKVVSPAVALSSSTTTERSSTAITETEQKSTTTPFQFNADDEDEEDSAEYTSFLQRDKWFEEDIDDDFETLEFDYTFGDESNKVRMWN